MLRHSYRFLAISLLCLFALGSLATSAFADTKVHEAAKIELWVPDGWKVDGNEKLMSVLEPNEEVGFLFIMLDADELKVALEQLDKQLKSVVQDVEMKDPKEGDLNGLKMLESKGKGLVEGKPVKVLVMLVETPSGKVMLVLGIADNAKFESHLETIGKIVGSIKGVK